MSTKDPTPPEGDIIPEAHLVELGPLFMAAVEARANGQVDKALEGFAAVLAREPRLAEPRMELGAIYLDMGRLEDAELQAREAIRILEAGGQWTEELPENVVLGMAWALLGATLKEQASSDAVVFGEDPKKFRDLIDQAAAAFKRAAELDPSDSDSEVTAMELEDN